MGKHNKSKNEQNESHSKTKIAEPEFEIQSDSKVLSAGEKKLLAQKERERKEQEEQDRLKKEREAEKKKKKNKSSSSKTKTKQDPPNNYKEDKPVAEIQQPKNTRYEDERSQEGTSYSRNYSNSKQNYANDQRNFGGKSNYYYTFSDGKNDREFQNFLHSRGTLNKKVHEVKGDLFTAPGDYSLAHCVAEDFSMGAGIAKEFRARFKRVSKLLDQNAKTGELAFLQDGDRFIYYLVTKELSRGKPTLYTLWKSLLMLQDHITKHNVTKLAIPQIGCGLDRLDWFEVRRMLEYIFAKNEIDIAVYILDINAEETQNPSKTSPRKSYVVHQVLPLTDIQAGTGLIYFGTEDGAVTPEIECLARKFDIINQYKTMRKSSGDVIKTIDRGEYLYGLIIRRTLNNNIVFADFEKCLFNLRKMLKTDQTVYIGFQGFVDKDDTIITEKLVNLMQNTLLDVEIWVCWPKELMELCPERRQ